MKSLKKIFFIGDSLSELGQGPIGFVFAMPVAAYTGLTLSCNTSMFAYALSGAKCDPDDSNSIATQITTVIANGNPNDIAVIFAGTNDISVLGHNETETYADLCANAQQLRAAGMKVIAVTMLAKERAADADPTAINTTRLAYNALIRGGSTFAFDAIADAGVLSEFDTIADASNATYYETDKVHLKTAGYNLVAGVVTAAIQPFV